MDAPTPDYSAAELRLTDRLIECGLERKGVSIKYDPDLLGFSINILKEAKAEPADFRCISEAVGYEFVLFENGELMSGYLEFQSEQMRPQLLRETTLELQEHGLLDGFPDFEDFTSVESYVHALEGHAGLKPGEALRVDGRWVTFEPRIIPGDFSRFSERYTKLLAVIRYTNLRYPNAFKFGFIGNEKVRPDDE
ncbi:MAG: hypothetical protein AAGH57_07250 [Pseudomonadota bacterium]